MHETPRLLAPHEVQAALAEAHRLVQQGQPHQALRLVAEVLRAAGLEREAGESVCRVQQALAAGSASAQAADELAGLLSLVSLHQTRQQAPMDTQQQQQQPWQSLSQPSQQQHWQLQPPLQPAQQQEQCLPGGGGGGPAGMEVEGGSGPGPPPSGSGSQLAGLVAAAEGASCVCQHCGGVVAAARLDVHLQAWCPALHGS